MKQQRPAVAIWGFSLNLGCRRIFFLGEISQPIRTRLGFHIIELTDFKPARQMTFEEVQPEIRLAIENEKRRAALQSLTADLLRRAKIVHPL